MKILVLSDTHLERGEALPAAVLAAAKEADLVIHAGDLVCTEVIDALRAITLVEAVAGNMDGAAISAQFPRTKLLTLAGVRVGIAHGSGAPDGIAARVQAQFPQAQVIIYGHSHHPEVCEEHGVLFLNPGSPTDNRYAPYHSFAWLHLGDGPPRAEIVRLEE